jgi:hypothetical protein
MKYMGYMGVMVYMDCTPVHADQFDVAYDPLKLVHVLLLVHVVHGGHGVHGLHADKLHALLSASRTTSCSC